ncbi:MAG TPA: sulfatase-like hydrolase/transferase, partial [Clostridia bacterium]|nr:sulfatase-like hydrolase/transferase [Clostridia bacterium]
IRMFFLNIRVRMAELKIKLFSKKTGLAQPAPKHDGTTIVTIQSVGKWDYLWADNRTFTQRLLPSALLSACFFFIFVIFGVYELYITNLSAFAFPFSAILPGIALVAVAGAVLFTSLLSLLRGRLFDLASSLLLGFILAGYTQGNLLNLSLGELTGDAIPWDLYQSEALVNLLIWTAIISLPFIVKFFWKRAWSFFIKLIPAILIVVQIISIIFLNVTATNPNMGSSGSYLSTQGIYEVADGNNIIVIVLDRLDNRYIELVLRDDPEFFDGMDGFTRFTNNLSLYSQTFPSVTNMLTGDRHYFEKNYATYMKEAWSSSTFIPGLREQGFASTFYMEAGYTYADAGDLKHVADNVEIGSIKVQSAAIPSFISLSTFRYAPLALKPFFWTSTDAFGKLIDVQMDPPPYITDDIAFHRGLKEKRLTKIDATQRFTYIHLLGSHAPYNMDEYGWEVEAGQSSVLLQTKGSFRIVFEYLEQLKSLGQYEDATIIVTSDHGARKSDTQPLDNAIVTGLFVKPAGKSGASLKYNNAPVSADSLRATVYQAAGLDYSAYGPTYFEVPEDADVVRFLYHRLYKTDSTPARLLTYQIDGDANDFLNWRLIEEVIIQ